MVDGKRRLVLIAHNVRSAHNVGSLLRTADGLCVEMVYLTGYTPYPESPQDDRPPHIRGKVSAAISKTALGAEKSVNWNYYADIQDCLDRLEKRGFTIAALEQTPVSRDITDFSPPSKVALVAGNEVEGLDEEILKNLKIHLRIPMLGAKESFNVAIAASIALYHLRYLDKNTP